MAKIRVAASGKIWANRGTREVLYSVLKLKKVENGILQIASPVGRLDGEILVSRAIFISGGKLKDRPTSGWEAIRLLLTVSEGTFQYLDYGDNDPGSLEQGLKIRLTDLINQLPDLPREMNAVTGHSTINKIRAMNADAARQEEEALINHDTMAALAKWEKDSMRHRTLAFWGLFLVASSVAVLIYFLQR